MKQKNFTRAMMMATAILSLGLFTACTDQTEGTLQQGTPMSVAVQSDAYARSVLIEDAFQAGAQIGVFLIEEDKTTYNETEYHNLHYTFTDGTWGIDDALKTPKLTDVEGKAVAYHPWSNTVTDYTQVPVTTAAQGKIHTYTLTLSATGMTVGTVAVDEWLDGEGKDDLNLEPDKRGPVVNSAGKENGVYAVTATGELIDYNDAAVDATCLGVALITDNQKIMIEKMGEANTTSIKAAYDADGASNTEFQNFYWGSFDTDVNGIDNTDEAAAKADFNGKANTTAIIATTDTDSYTTYANMGTYCTIFNATAAENQGFTDWYVPALGQLYEIYSNKANINTALSAMSSTAFSYDKYWSSSEATTGVGWYMGFYYGYVKYDNKCNGSKVRFVRDI